MTDWEPDWGYEEWLDEGARHVEEVHGGRPCDCIVPDPGPVTGPADPDEPPF